MASPLSHAAVAIAIGSAFPGPHSKRWWWSGVVGSIVPDLDVVACRLGVDYDAMLGHRGFSHSLAFAGMAAFAVAFVVARDRSRWGSRQVVALYMFVAVASHGILDALTEGGLGIEFFAPFSSRRFLFQWRPIVAGQIFPRIPFTTWNAAVFWNELFVVVPAAVFFATMTLVRRRCLHVEQAERVNSDP